MCSHALPSSLSLFSSISLLMCLSLLRVCCIATLSCYHGNNGELKKPHWALFLLLLLLLLICFLCVIASNSNRCGKAVPLQRRSQLLRKNLTDRQTRSCDFIKHTHTHALSPVLSDVARPPLPAHFLSFVFPSIVGPCQHHQGNRSTALMPSPRLSVLQQLTDPHSVITNYR